MYKVAQFFKVDFDIFAEELNKIGDFSKEQVQQIYNQIKLPKRATKGSAGYDFFSPVTFKLKAGETVLVPTGIRARIDEGWFLGIMPRSGLGFRYRFQLDNTIGVIDSDYYFSDNQGHIMIKMTYDKKDGQVLDIPQGKAFAQGVFLPYGLVVDDESQAVRNGGLGST